jgi:uncharacterized protein
VLDSPLTLLNGILLFTTAFIAGGINALAGGGSFITFPALIFTGMNPITANATNNTAMWVAALASVRAYRKELTFERKELVLLVGISLLGGIGGSILLLFTSGELFKKLIPYLLLSATLVFTFSESLKQWFLRQRQKTMKEGLPLGKLLVVQFIIAVYGGFFGAGMGILMLATLTILENKSIHKMNALKAFLATCINGIAIIPFIIAQVIAWQEAAVMAIGGSLGSYFIADYARQLDPKIIRTFVIFTGFSMTMYFFIKT